jgi:uridylate kinase
MLAGVMNGLALSELLKAEDLKVKTFSSFDVPRFVDTLSRYKVIEYIDK